MRRAAVAFGVSMICLGIFGISWLFPFFTLNEPFLSWYGSALFGPEWDAPGGAGEAAAFLWMITAPAGFLVSCAGVPLLLWGQSKTEAK